MTTLLQRSLVEDELTEFYTGPLREALRASGLKFSYGDAGTGSDFDDMAFDPTTHTALVEVIGDFANETGRVVGYGRGREIVFNAVNAYTERFGAPATFVAVLSDSPEPAVYTDTVAKIAR